MPDNTLMLFNGFNKGDREYTLDNSYHIRLFISIFLPNLKRGSAPNSRCASPFGTEIKITLSVSNTLHLADPPCCSLYSVHYL